MTQRKIKGRAHTPEEKRAIVERLLKAWEKVPHLRLGQFLENSATVAGSFDRSFYTEDEDLVGALERFAEEQQHYVYHVTPGSEDEIDAILDSDEPPPQKLIDLMKGNK